MLKEFRILFVLLLIVGMLLVPTAAYAQDDEPPEEPGTTVIVEAEEPADPVFVFPQIDMKQVGAFLGLILTAIYVISYTIDGLKKAGLVGEGKAGYWNEAISGLTGLLVFTLRYLGQESEVVDANTFALMLAQSVVFVIVTAIGSKYFHLLREWLRGLRPKPNTPLPLEAQPVG